MNKKQLILDAGGVIVTNLTPGFWETIAAAASKTYEEIRAAYAADIRDGLWTGTLAEAEFWRWLSAQCPGSAEQEARTLLQRNIRLLPAFHSHTGMEPACGRAYPEAVTARNGWRRIWKGCGRIWGMSSFRARQGQASLPGIYTRPCTRSWIRRRPSLYVDDQRKNLTAAEGLGWQGLLADEEGLMDRTSQSMAAQGVDNHA